MPLPETLDSHGLVRGHFDNKYFSEMFNDALGNGTHLHAPSEQLLKRSHLLVANPARNDVVEIAEVG